MIGRIARGFKISPVKLFEAMEKYGG